MTVHPRSNIPFFDFLDRGLREGFLTQNDRGVFTVHKRIRLHSGFLGFCFLDGPAYIGPFSQRNDGIISSDVPVITAMASGYRPLQVIYNPRGIDASGCDEAFDLDGSGCKLQHKGILDLFLCRASQPEAATPSNAGGPVAGRPVADSKICRPKCRRGEPFFALRTT
ncbi:MAG: hypothetical protein ABFC96_09485 [Thermoguttaceae bacterium]